MTTLIYKEIKPRISNNKYLEISFGSQHFTWKREAMNIHSSRFSDQRSRRLDMRAFRSVWDAQDKDREYFASQMAEVANWKRSPHDSKRVR